MGLALTLESLRKVSASGCYPQVVGSRSAVYAPTRGAEVGHCVRTLLLRVAWCATVISAVAFGCCPEVVAAPVAPLPALLTLF
jgi:hypothetical protein